MSSTPKSTLQCIVGLGNPGPQYAETRHNAGAWFVQALCQANDQSLSLNGKLRAHCGSLSIAGTTVHMLIPAVFMNLSGQVVRQFCHFYKIEPENCLIAHDELDLPNGAVRVKFGGGHGGHNGLRDIMQQWGGQGNFYRLRLGIGRPAHPQHEVVDFVLAKPTVTEKIAIDLAIQQAVAQVPEMVAGRWDKVMQILHTGEKNGL